MLAKQQNRSQHSLFFSLESTLNHKHPPLILANKIDWKMFEREFSPLYCPDNGRPEKPIRLMVGLLILKFAISLMKAWRNNGVKTTTTNTFEGNRSFNLVYLVKRPRWFIFVITSGKRVLS